MKREISYSKILKIPASYLNDNLIHIYHKYFLKHGDEMVSSPCFKKYLFVETFHKSQSSIQEKSRDIS